MQITRTIHIPEVELTCSYARSSGPGGQNVNKLATKVTLRWAVLRTSTLPSPVHERFIKKFKNRINDAGELVLYSDKYRSQLRNKTDCLERLKAMVSSVLSAPRKRKPTKPTRGSVERRLKAKKKQSDKKKNRRSSRIDD